MLLNNIILCEYFVVRNSRKHLLKFIANILSVCSMFSRSVVCVCGELNWKGVGSNHICEKLDADYAFVEAQHVNSAQLFADDA